MADSAPAATTPSPFWTLLLGLLPSLNTCLVAIVSAAIAICTTLYATKGDPGKAKPVQLAAVAPPAPAVTADDIRALRTSLAAVSKQIDSVSAEMDKRLPPARPAPGVKAAPAKK